jgi:hypothetical protein
VTRATLADLVTWFDLHGTAVQAFAALITVALTLVIIVAAVWAALSAGRQARQAARQVEIAREQVREAIEARLAAVRPYLHVERGDADGPDLAGLKIGVVIRNVGVGPALSTRVRMHHNRLGIQRVGEHNNPILCGAGAAFEAWFTATGGGLQEYPLPPDVDVGVEYRDLAGQWWRTRVQIALGLPHHSVKGDSVADSALRDQAESVYQIRGPAMHQTRPDERWWEDAHRRGLAERAASSDGG